MNPLTNVRNLQKINERELELGVSGKSSSWHQNYKDSAYVYIGGLPYDLTEGDIICVFSQFGEVVDINLVRDKKTGKSKGFSFLCYEDQRSTILAVDNLNGTKIVGRTIRVDHVSDYRRPKDDDDVDEVTKSLREQGCAPSASDQRKQESEVEEYELPVEKSAIKKEKTSEKKYEVQMKKMKRERSCSLSYEPTCSRIKTEEIKIKKERYSPDADRRHDRSKDEKKERSGNDDEHRKRHYSSSGSEREYSSTKRKVKHDTNKHETHRTSKRGGSGKKYEDPYHHSDSKDKKSSRHQETYARSSHYDAEEDKNSKRRSDKQKSIRHYHD